MSEQTITDKSNIIRNETTQYANTRERVADVLDDLNETKANKTDVSELLNSTSESLAAHLSADNPHNITKSTVGLSNVDNTSDANKPISSAQSQVNTNLSNGITAVNNNKLDKPTITGNSTDYPFVVGVDNSGNPAKLPAGDLGKNAFNANLTNTTQRLHTLGADFSINTASKYYKLQNLISAQGDASFSKRLKTKPDGTFGQVDEATVIKEDFNKIPQLLSAQEKDAWGIAWSDQYSNSSLQVYNISPPIVKREDNIKRFLVSGLNLNTNPTYTRVTLIPVGNAIGEGEIDVRGIQPIDEGSFLVDIDGLSIPENIPFNLVFRTTNPIVQTYRTTGEIMAVANVDYINVNSLTWERKTYNDNPTIDNISTGNSFQLKPDASIKPLEAGDGTYIFSAKSSKIFNASENGYLRAVVNCTLIYDSNASQNCRIIVGVGSFDTPLELLDQSVSKFNLTAAGYRLYGLYNNSVSIENINSMGTTQRTGIIEFIKRNSILTTIIKVEHRVQVTNRDISGVDLSFYLSLTNHRFDGQTISGLIEEAYTF